MIAQWNHIDSWPCGRQAPLYAMSATEAKLAPDAKQAPKPESKEMVKPKASKPRPLERERHFCQMPRPIIQEIYCEQKHCHLEIDTLRSSWCFFFNICLICLFIIFRQACWVGMGRFFLGLVLLSCGSFFWSRPGLHWWMPFCIGLPDCGGTLRTI